MARRPLEEVGNNYEIDNIGEFGDWAPIATVAVNGGYEVAWKSQSAGQYQVFSYTNAGNYTGSVIGVVSGTNAALEQIETVFNQDLNGDGSIGVPGAGQSGSQGSGQSGSQGSGQSGSQGSGQSGSQGSGQSGSPGTVLSNNGTTELVQVGSNYYVYAAGTTTGPELTYNNTPYFVGEFGDWAPIAAVAVNGGYDVAWKSQSAGQYQVFSYTNAGNYTGSVIGVVSGTSAALEQIETVFNQDLNGDGSIGVPGAGQSGSQGSGQSGSQGSGQSGSQGSGQSGSQGSGQSGSPGTVLSNNGTTELVQVGSNYYVYAAGTTTGPELTYNNTPYFVGEFGDWAPIAAVAVNGGYDVAWKSQSAGQYQVFSYTNAGNYTGSVIGVVSGTSAALEQIETVFNQDLNGDGSIGVPGAGQSGSQGSGQSGSQGSGQSGSQGSGQSGSQGSGQSGSPGTVLSNNGTTELVQVGSNYYVYAAGTTTGPELTYNNTPYFVGEFGDWAPIAAVAVNGGYDVAWKSQSAGQYQVFSYTNAGNYTGSVIGVVSGTNAALEQIEPIFGQDLNRDGFVGLYATGGGLQLSNTNPATAIVLGPGAPVEIGTGATLELNEPNSASIVFASSTGTLKLDQPSTFNGQISNFAGNGTLAGSDHIDLVGISFASVQDSLTNGVLTVGDGIHSAALNFNGSYVLANFKLSNDGSGGTLIIDPPVSNIVGSGGSSAGAQNQRFAAVAPNLPNGGAGSIGIVAIGPGMATEREVAVEGVAIQNSGGSINVTVAATHTTSANGEAAQPLTLTLEDRNSSAANRSMSITTGGVQSINQVLSPMTGTFASSSQSAADETEQGQPVFQSTDNGHANGVAREIVSPHDVIRAIDDGDIAIKRNDANATRAGARHRVWIFDDAAGSFVPPAPEPLTIVIDREHAKAPATEVAQSLELAATAAMVSAKPSWLSFVREFGRKAARVMSREANE